PRAPARAALVGGPALRPLPPAPREAPGALSQLAVAGRRPQRRLHPYPPGGHAARRPRPPPRQPPAGAHPRALRGSPRLPAARPDDLELAVRGELAGRPAANELGAAVAGSAHR